MTLPPEEIKFSEKDLARWNLVRDFQKRLAPLLKKRAPTKTETDPRRTLSIDGYFSLVLFAMFNPVIDTMRGLCYATTLAKVQRDVCSGPVSLGSFSEAQHLYDPELLRNLMQQISLQAEPNFGDARLKELGKELAAVDGTLIPALSRMSWALWQDDNHRAAKFHVKFSVLRQTVLDATLTTGNGSERDELRKLWKPDEFYSGDRGYGADYSFLAEMRQAGSSFAIRIRNDAVISEVQSLPLSDEDQKAGVVSDQWVNLGKQWDDEPIRVVRIRDYDTELLIATDRADLPAELISLIYRYRWQIELFFKWIKCILGCRHLLAESPHGVAIQLYCACIVALMLTIATGRKPTKRHWELIQWYMCGMATLDELLKGLGINKKMA